MTIEAQTLEVDRKQARELWRAYKAHQHYSEPIDQEIARTYQLIAQGRLVIRALESIRLAGLNAHGLPKLAIARATATHCTLYSEVNGGATFTSNGSSWANARERHGTRFTFPAGSFPGIHSKWGQRAMMPLVPVHLRPKRGLANYHVLWEAEWERVVPRDPLLLRQIGKGDMWLVVAQWDLTEVERAALASRMSS